MPELDDIFTALGDDTRRQILARLRNGEQRLSDLAKPFAMSQTAVSKHVRVLSDAGLLTIEKRGRTRFCRLDSRAMHYASTWFEDYQQLWLDNLDNLGRYLAQTKQTGAHRDKP